MSAKDTQKTTPSAGTVLPFECLTSNAWLKNSVCRPVGVRCSDEVKGCNPQLHHPQLATVSIVHSPSVEQPMILGRQSSHTARDEFQIADFSYKHGIVCMCLLFDSPP